MVRLTLPTLVLCLAAGLMGCSHLPKFSPNFGPKLGIGGGDEPAPFQLTASSDPYQAAMEAKKSNAVVLQVFESKTPNRVIPLPPDGSPVYVSSLLKQSGLYEEFPRMKAKLHRDTPNAISGVKMGVMFLPKSNQVAPEYDYVLKPGDRLEVAELEISPLEALSDVFGPSRKRRLVAY
jgi:hypothetical protein